MTNEELNYLAELEKELASAKQKLVEVMSSSMGAAVRWKAEYDELERDRDRLQKELNKTLAMPKVAPPGLLMSMALRYDHALGCPGYYDQPIFCNSGPDGVRRCTHAKRLKSALGTMEKLYEEVVGYGFYSPEKEEEYAKMIEGQL